MSGSSRQTILDRIRAATHGDDNAYAEVPRHYIRRGTLERRQFLQLMTERLHEYGAEVVESSAGDLPAVIHQQLMACGKQHFVVPPGLPAEWLATDLSWRMDDDLSYEEIERCGGVVTGASAGVADSGTIVLHHSDLEGRRVITLLPDFHLCILRASDIVETLPEYFGRFPHLPRTATFISGPSATADIEMTRIKGVHGPRFLNVIIVCDDA
jgi:L-lactate dehydrogenase complex protein LldG